MIQLIRGFKDILPDEVGLWQKIEHTACDVFEIFGFKEIRTPILESTDLFIRSIGENTDIVEKEMYTFPDRKGEMITLRPEATASVVRSYIQHKIYSYDPVQKFYTIGPMFRRERPQKGRYRQFYQINAEIFGISSPFIDSELIFLLMTIFAKLSLDEISTKINSLGCPLCRIKFKESLISFLSEISNLLCEDCTRRSQSNPLRVLDCKVPSCKEAMKVAPSINDFLCTDCLSHFEIVKDNLNKLKIPYIVDKNLVRGLDYYTRTTFEIQTNLLGSQNAIAGGGRYDCLMKALGGPDTPGIGFAIGLDRLVDILSQKQKQPEEKIDVFIAPLGDKARIKAFEWSCSLKLESIKTEMEFSDKSLKSMMKRADRLNSKYVLIVGDKELDEGVAILRDMATKEQTTIQICDIVSNIKLKQF
ncbi:MAG: histidine--tRNA ligase [Desulfobacterales bacterium]|nr:histidine--tRNA ligase [Desulfobacterales bacterium]